MFKIFAIIDISKIEIFKVSGTERVNGNDIECAWIEVIRKNTKNIIVSYIYWPPKGDSHKFLDEIKTLIRKNHEQFLFLAGDLNINSLDYSINTDVRYFFNLVFQNGVLPLINRSTRVTKSSATITDHVLTNTTIDLEPKKRSLCCVCLDENGFGTIEDLKKPS